MNCSAPNTLARLETRHVNRLIDEKAETPVAAMHLRKRLNAVMKWAIGDGMITVNPVTAAKKISTKTDGYRTWSDADIAAYRAHWPEGTPQRLSMELLLFTGMRRSDVVRVGWSDVRDGAIHYTTQKSQHITKLAIPVHPELMRHLEDCPKEAKTFLQTEYGAPRSEKAFTNYLREAAHAAGLPSDSSPHGLRKAACRMLAEAGCRAHMIQSITGHKHLAEVETYTKAANQRRLAEMAIANLSNLTEWVDKTAKENNQNNILHGEVSNLSSAPPDKTDRITAAVSRCAPAASPPFLIREGLLLPKGIPGLRVNGM